MQNSYCGDFVTSLRSVDVWERSRGVGMIGPPPAATMREASVVD